MKVLLITRPNDGKCGGDLNQANNTLEALKKLGVDCHLQDHTNLHTKYDIIHFFVLNLPNMSEKIRIAKESGAKVVLSPIYRDKKYGE
jgi:hypothetical protein